MKIAVCGCSFSATVDGEYAGTHWSELVAEDSGAELINLARQGISNSVIRLQIAEAIRHKPDWVFVNATTTDRLEIATDKRHLSNPRLGYNPALGLSNFNYDKSAPSCMISETLFTMIDWDLHPYRGKSLDGDTRIAVENYSAFIYDLHWRLQVDNWIINSGLWDLHERGIKFIYNQTILNEIAEMHMLPDWFAERYFVGFELDLLSLMRKHANDFDPGYHTTPETQRWMADRYLQMMKDRA
jgi:hypothetical protein